MSFTFPLTFFSKTTSSYSSIINSFSPYFYWRLEETSGTTISDSSSNNRTGTLSGTYTLNQEGSLSDNSKCFYFNGGVIQSPNLTIGTNYSIVFRFKTSANNAGFCIFDNTFGNYSPGLYLKNGLIELYLYQNARLYLTSSLTYNDNNWHTAAFTISSSDGTKLFIDGNLLVANNTITNPQSITGAWYFGRSNDGFNGITSINGFLDELAFFTTPLTNANILTIHQSI